MRHSKPAQLASVAHYNIVTLACLLTYVLMACPIDSADSLLARVLARNAFVERIAMIAMMFFHPSVCPSVRPSWAGIYCDQSVHFSAGLSLRLDSLMFWAP